MKTHQQLHGISGWSMIGCSLLFAARLCGQELVTEPVRVFGHELGAAALSPDGTYLATGGDRGAFLWSVESGRILRTLTGHTNTVHQLVFSPDGSILVTSDNGGSSSSFLLGTTRVWDVATGGLLYIFAGNDGRFSPDGTKLLVSGRDSVLWDLASGETICSFEGGLYLGEGRAFSPDGQLVLTLGDEVRIWSATTGNLVQNLDPWPPEYQLRASFSPQANLVLMWAGLPELRVYDAETGQLLQTLLHSNNIRHAAYSSDGSRIATMCNLEDFIHIWDAASGTFLYSIADTRTPFWLSPVGAYLLNASQSSFGTSLNLWDVSFGQWLGTIEGYISEYNWNVKPFSADGLKVVTHVGGGGWAIAVWEVSTGQLVQSFPGGVPDSSHGCFSPTGDRVLTGGAVGPLLWDTQTGELIRAYKWPCSTGHFAHYGSGNWVAFSADGTKVAAAASHDIDSGTVVWDATTGEVLLTLPPAYCLAFSPDSTQLLTGTWEHTVNLWDVSSGQLIRTFTGNAQGVASVAFSPDGTQVLAGAGFGTPPDSTARLWDAQTGQLLRSFTGHSWGAVRAVFSPDGTQVLTGSSQEPQAMLWNASTGALIRSFIHGDGKIPSGVAFSPDGTQVAAHGYSELWVWDLATGKVLKRLATGGSIDRFTFSPNGAYLLVGKVLWAVRDPILLRMTMDQPNSPVITWDNPTGLALVLQQCPDLSAGDWTDVSVTTPGRYAIVNPNESAMFYRLKEP